MKEKIPYIGVLLPILAIVLLLQIYKVDPFESFSLRFNDINFDLQEKSPSPDVVFVAVDEQSVNEYGRWPWDRAKLAKGIDNLNQADVVLMDMIFSEPTTVEQDTLLSNSLSNLKSSVCGFFLRHKATQDIGADEEELLSDSSLDLLQSQISEFQSSKFISAPFAEMNILPIMESCTLSGSFSTLSGSDHLLRAYPISVYFKDILYPSLAIQGLRLKFDKDLQRVDDLHVEINEKVIGLDQNGFIRLNFYKPKQYDIVSFLDVAQKKVKPEYFKGKIVILGITEVGAGDVVSTPIGSLPGPLLHYTFISNLLQDHLIKEPKNITPFLIIFMVLLPFIVLCISKKIISRVVINVMSYLIVYAGVRYLFVFDMIYIDLFYPLLAFLLSLVAVEALAFKRQEESGKFLEETFSSYMSGELLEELKANPDSLKLGGEKKELSILFSDIRGFTTISEGIEPEVLITILNRYFTPMTKSVLENQGMLDKYIGDAVMAFFNAPVNVEHHADAACYCALSMIEKLNALNEELISEGIAPIKIGIGINTAKVIVGNIGSDDRKEYTVIGDGVNLASRIESLTKKYGDKKEGVGVDILITSFTIAKLKNKHLYREMEPVEVKGKKEPVTLYELMSDTSLSREIKKEYDEALEAYKQDDTDRAKKLFLSLVEKYDDNPSKYFLNYIANNRLWAINKMTTK